MSNVNCEIQQIIDLIEAGCQPVIELVSDPDGVFPLEPGMKTRCLSLTVEWESKDEIVYEIVTNSQDFEQYNMALEKPIWYDKNGFKVLHSELEPAVYRKNHSVYIGTGSEREWKLVEDNKQSIKLLDMYKKSDFNGSYLKWLENELDAFYLAEFHRRHYRSVKNFNE